jgi:hypothetical protein
LALQSNSGLWFGLCFLQVKVGSSTNHATNDNNNTDNHGSDGTTTHTLTVLSIISSSAAVTAAVTRRRQTILTDSITFCSWTAHYYIYDNIVAAAGLAVAHALIVREAASGGSLPNFVGGTIRESTFISLGVVATASAIVGWLWVRLFLSANFALVVHADLALLAPVLAAPASGFRFPRVL